jgi:hypothetical protein
MSNDDALPKLTEEEARRRHFQSLQNLLTALGIHRPLASIKNLRVEGYGDFATLGMHGLIPSAEYTKHWNELVRALMLSREHNREMKKLRARFRQRAGARETVQVNGAKLKKLRRARGLAQWQLAERADVEPLTISRGERSLNVGGLVTDNTHAGEID